MGDLINQEGGDLIGFLHNAGDGISVPMPFERDIFLFDTFVAGTTYIEGIDELEPYIQEGDKLTFIREPGNPYDENAIRIQNRDGVKLGYVPKKDNIVFARLMDAGKLLFGKVSAKEYAGRWLKIDIQVYLHE